jgi:hypothetical protein
MARVMVFNELSTIFQLYRGSQFYSLREKKKYPDKTTDMQQFTDKLLSYNIVWNIITSNFVLI